jgi:hypothetical protein
MGLGDARKKLKIFKSLKVNLLADFDHTVSLAVSWVGERACILRGD